MTAAPDPRAVAELVERLEYFAWNDRLGETGSTACAYAAQALKDLSAALAAALNERDEARKDCEQGFAAGAYARLKNLQEAERRLDEALPKARALDALEKWLKEGDFARFAEIETIAIPALAFRMTWRDLERDDAPHVGPAAPTLSAAITQALDAASGSVAT